MGQHFVARFEMMSAVINPSPLDAIVHKFMTDELNGDYITAREQLPFEKVNGVLCSSFPIMQDWQDAFPITLTNALRTKQVKEEWVIPNTTDKSTEKEPIPREEWSKNQVKKYGGTDEVPYRTKKSTIVSWGDSEKGGGNIMNEYQPILAPFIYFCGITTDFKLLKSYMERIYFIGKGRNKGQGQVKEITLMDGGKCNGIVDSSGNPLRPIPVDSNTAVIDNPIIADATYQSAYWDPNNHAKCYVHDFKRNWKLSEIEKELS